MKLTHLNQMLSFFQEKQRSNVIINKVLFLVAQEEEKIKVKKLFRKIYATKAYESQQKRTIRTHAQS